MSVNSIGFFEGFQEEEIKGFEQETDEKIAQLLFGKESQTTLNSAPFGQDSFNNFREVISLTETTHASRVLSGLGAKLRKTASKVGKFIARHKTELLVGVAICTAGVAIAFVTGCTCSAVVSGVVVAGAGSIFRKEEEDRGFDFAAPPPPSKEEIAFWNNPCLVSSSKEDLPSSSSEFLATNEGLWVSGQFFSNEDLRKASFQRPLGFSFLPNFRPMFGVDVTYPHRGPSFEVPSSTRLCEYSPSFDLRDQVFSKGSEPVENAVGLEKVSEGARPRGSIPKAKLEWKVSKPYLIEGKREEGCYIGWINGINNSLKASKESGTYIQELSNGLAISGVYNCTHTPVLDVIEAAFLNHQGISPNTARLLQTDWKTFHEANMHRPNAKLLQICHSQGAIHVRNALQGVSWEVQDRVIVIAIAPAAVVSKELCFMSFNYASEKDFVYKLEPAHRPVVSITLDEVLLPTFGESENHRDELIILKPHPAAKGIDHEFQSPTYQSALQDILDIYQRRKGECSKEEMERLK